MAAPDPGVVAARPRGQRQGRRLRLQAASGHRIQRIPDGDGYRVPAWAGAPIALYSDPLPLEHAQGVAEDWVRGQDGGGLARKDAKGANSPRPRSQWHGPAPGG